MDSGNIIYLIAVIIYFIYTAVKGSKKKQLEEEGEKRGTENPEGPTRPVSFDDLLKEIRSGQQGSNKDPAPSHQDRKIESEPDRPVYQSYEEEVPIPKLEESTYGKYEGFVSERERPKILTLDEQISLSSALTGLGVSEQGVTLSKSSAKPTNRYADLLKNPETVKDAVILSEILNRKFY